MPSLKTTKYPKESYIHVGIRVHKELRERLAKYCSELDHTMQGTICKAIEEKIKKEGY